MTTADRRIAVGLFSLAFVAYAYFFGGGGWNQNAQFDLTRAIVERQTFAIDAYRTNTYDIAQRDRHTYANKAPGISLLACVPYGVLYAVERAAGADVNSFAMTTLNLWLCTVTVCAASGGLLVAILFLYLRRFVDARDAAMLAIVAAFGTYLFAYSTVFFLHVPSALFLFWAFTHVDDRPMLAGVLAGVAVLCNYASLPALIVIGALGPFRRPWRDRFIAALAALPFAAILFWYQAVCFGSPLRTAIQAESDVFHTKGAAMGVLVAPKAGVLFAILISRYRGLFFLSPFLVLSIAGATVMIRRRAFLRELATCIGVFAAFALLNCMFNNWDGGSAIGPRYILPVVPFLMLPVAFAWPRMQAASIALAVISIVFNFAVAAVNPLPSRTIADPLFRYTFPLLVTGHLPDDTPRLPPYAWKMSLGHVSVNRQSADEFVAFVKHPPGSPEAEWASFNIGELVAPGSVASLIPIAIWIVAGGAWIVRRA